MLKFIIDTQLPPKLAKFLRTKGFPSVHTTYSTTLVGICLKIKKS